MPTELQAVETMLLKDRASIDVTAVCVGERIDVKALGKEQRLAESPTVIRAASEGLAVLFRYGAVVLFNLDPVEQANFLRNLEPMVQRPYDNPIRESTDVRFVPDSNEQIRPEGIILRGPSIERFQLIADALAKSVVLERYETGITQGFERIEPLAVGLREVGRARHGSRQLLKNIGEALLIEHMMVNRVEVAEKPGLLWDRPDLEPFYIGLEKEYEIADRRLALERKLDLVSRTVETVLNLLNHQRSLRVEWYIVILIVVEIILTVYDMFIRT